ncbi:phage holin family protein [Neisseria leonii]|uniref:phage holin family protein n=1 Tax=Neisseria leonii TaxID=2995413 RepID=UPI00237A63A7|nr:phage holin family protein [Neisseria sp. 3986]MDD9326319.1 phage holin family protein [Neisseria sp. 3986]
MSLSRSISRYKTLLNKGTDLLLLRLQILQMDVSQQLGTLVRLLAVVAVAAVLALVALISLLFGLNAVLPRETAVWTFFGIGGGLLLLIAVLFAWALSGWRHQCSEVNRVLGDIRRDLAYLRGDVTADTLNQTELEKHEQIKP